MCIRDSNRIINILKFGDGLESELAPDWATEDDLLFLTEYLTDPKPENRARAEHLCACLLYTSRCV